MFEGRRLCLEEQAELLSLGADHYDTGPSICRRGYIRHHTPDQPSSASAVSFLMGGFPLSPDLGLELVNVALSNN